MCLTTSGACASTLTPCGRPTRSTVPRRKRSSSAISRRRLPTRATRCRAPRSSPACHTTSSSTRPPTPSSTGCTGASSNPRTPTLLAFHEAFADIVALFQHFSFPEVLRHQIGKTRGDLADQNLLGELAYEFGRATGVRGALRSAIGTKKDGKWQPHVPQPGEYKLTTQPHTRGSHLVAAVFDAFLAIYKSRVADLLRIATGGTGRLPEGQLHPDLVNRLADEAAKSSRHVLNMCIRALDYCPPCDLTFGEYLRALITADFDLVRDDYRCYRIAMIEAFRRRGIFPDDVRTLSEDGLCWHAPDSTEQKLLRRILPRAAQFRKLMPNWDLSCERSAVFDQMLRFQEKLERHIKECIRRKVPGHVEALRLLGLDAALEERELRVDSLRPARRIGPDGQSIVELIVEITQRLPAFWQAGTTGDGPGAERQLPALPDGLEVAASAAGHNAESSPVHWGKGFVVLRRYRRQGDGDADFWVRGGCTLLVDPETATVRYAVVKNIRNTARYDREAAYRARADGSLRFTYFGRIQRLEESEAFAMLHRSQPEELADGADSW